MLLILDSGIGGLTVAAALRTALPGAPMAYLADAGGFPYGALDDAALVARLVALAGAAIDQVRPSVVVVACNTASTVALTALRQAFPVPFVGCVPPIKPAAAWSKTRVIGLLATPATVRRVYVRDLAARFAGGCVVLHHGSAHLATLAEAVFRNEEPDPALLAAELAALFGQPGGEAIDAVALGCTHYAFLLPWMRRLAPRVEHWLDPAQAVARQAARLWAMPPGAEDGGAWNGVGLTTAPLSDATRRGLARYGFEECRTMSFQPGFRTAPPPPASRS